MRAPWRAPGANVVINGFGAPADIEKERSAIETDYKVKALYSSADMTKPAEIAEMIATCEKNLRSVDILITMPASSSFRRSRSFPIDKWDAIIAINLSSAFHGIRAAIPGMKKRGWGRIINTASAHSLVASPFKSAYVSAKHGIAGLTKTQRSSSRSQDHRQLHLAGLCLDAAGRAPDSGNDEGAQHDQGAGHQGRAARSQPTKEFVTSEQVAALALFLCSDDAGADHRLQLLHRRWLDGGVGTIIGNHRVGWARAKPSWNSRRFGPKDKGC